MVADLQQRITVAVLSGAECDVIEQSIIDPPQLDEEQKSALWLYAHALTEPRSEAMLSGWELRANSRPCQAPAAGEADRC
jgi:hypothetical protein